jgi:hypothetical protein
MRKVLGGVILALIAVGGYAQFSNPAMDVPAYHASAPIRPLPPILHGQQLTGPNFSHSYQVAAYKLAAKVSPVLYQEPCYCHCDRAMGHASLHSCFEGLHGAECSTCLLEGVYTYRETQRGQSPEQIRAGIERGEFAKIDLNSVTFPAK